MGGEGDYHAVKECACLSASGEVLRARFGNRCGVPCPLTPNSSPRWGEGSRTAEEHSRTAPGVALQVSRQKPD